VSSQTGPWPGIGVYTATKAALNRMIDTWRSEHPEVGFARILVGPTDEGATTAEWHEGALPYQARWPAIGLVSGVVSPPQSIARQVVAILTDPSRIWDVTVQPRDPARPWPGQ
jgi:NAD(P)-dependent dehydrogenase (short-subunit alcohol dehydrogenase family)